MISQRIAVRRGQMMGLVDQPGPQCRRVDALDPIRGHLSASWLPAPTPKPEMAHTSPRTRGLPRC